MKDRIVIQPPSEFRWGGVHGSFDILKVILAYVVILRHFTQSFLPAETVYSTLICNGLSTVAVPIYFIISGYLFFSKPFSMQRLKHQLLRILRLYLAWTIVYLPLNMFKNVMKNANSLVIIRTFIQEFIFSGSYFHLWYLPSLIFALAFVSLIRNIKMQYSVVLSSGLFILGLLAGSYIFFVPQLSGVVELYSKVFITFRNGVFFGAIYVYFGYIFSQFGFKIKRALIAFGIALGLFLLCVEGVLLFKYGGITVTDITAFALPTSVLTFIFAQQQEVNIKEEKLLFLRKFSTVLFCAHPIFTAGFSFVCKHFISIPTACIFVLVMLGSTVLSTVIVKLSEKFKPLSYFV